MQLQPDKGYLLEGRLNPVAQSHGLGGLSNLVATLRRQPHGALADEVVDAMTTNETSFFRDVTPFQALRRTLLPELFERNQRTRRLSLWCAACSTGQEPYSLAMLLHEMPEFRGWRIDILATDLSDRVLARARTGLYSAFECSRGLTQEMRDAHFEPVGQEWRLRRHIREMVRFEALNLAQPWPHSQLDLVLLRNVLIYLPTPIRREILLRTARSLAPTGVLMVGASENLFEVGNTFVRDTAQGATFYRLGPGTRPYATPAPARLRPGEGSST